MSSKNISIKFEFCKIILRIFVINFKTANLVQSLSALRTHLNTRHELNEAKKLTETLKLYFSEQHADIDAKRAELDRRQLELHKNESEFHQICLQHKHVTFESVYFDDSLILTHKNQRDLSKMLPFKDAKWKLMYRATLDGFSAKNFHEKCDGVKKTLTVIKSQQGFIFGGYTDEAWSSKYASVNDTNAFLFSLLNPSNSPIVIKCNHLENAIYCNPNNLSIFGGIYDFKEYQNDLFIADNSNLNANSYSNLGHSYTHHLFKYESPEAGTFFNGTKYFQTNEIEVFQRI